MDISRRALIRPQVIFRTGNVSLGKGTTVNYRCVFDNRAQVTIGERVGIGIGVIFITSSHSSGDCRQRAGEGFLATITVGDGAWLGSGCTILPGVTIGAGVVVAAGAMVTKDCAPNGLYAGVPARRLRDLP
ncbi:acetyltransferase-like isoleucine patch superfamily enzyme [Nakamurella sp. UYEF19]|uniref:acyltransferase n=1 Tax=Nakamurella sp. UYEF19 TaxID=1756392 RepID=UPI003394F7DD